MPFLSIRYSPYITGFCTKKRKTILAVYGLSWQFYACYFIMAAFECFARNSEESSRFRLSTSRFYHRCLQPRAFISGNLGIEIIKWKMAHKVLR